MKEKEMKRKRFWSEDQIKKIKKLYDVDRLSFSMIAKELNTTKNSIIGVYWRYRKKNNIFIDKANGAIPPGYIGRKELASILGVHIGTVSNRLSELPHIKLGKRERSTIVFNKKDVFKFIENKYGNMVLKLMNEKGERNET